MKQEASIKFKKSIQEIDDLLNEFEEWLDQQTSKNNGIKQ